ncbi:MAG: helix-turn-helix domain-containing protein [Caulobacteraceae bacterium]|nr:helix-turn-helix domain-containing protein [Caulobacteraceae bacterium]
MDSRAYAFDTYVIDTLMRDLVGHDRSPSAFLVYLALAAAAGEGRVTLSLAQIAEQTGLSKRGVQSAVARLKRRGLILQTKTGETQTPRYEAMKPWRRRYIDG